MTSNVQTGIAVVVVLLVVAGLLWWLGSPARARAADVAGATGGLPDSGPTG